MLHKKILLPLLLLFILTPLIISADTPPRPHPSPTVVFESRPDAAEVWIDGKFVGSAPLSYRVAPGNHKLEVSRAKYATWTRTLTVEADQPTHVAALLQEGGEKPCQ